MTDHFTPTSSEETVQVLSQTETRTVEAVSGYTKPSGVRLTLLVPLTAWQKGNGDTYLETPAMWIEQLLAAGIVTNVLQYQQTDPSRLLSSYLALTVTYAPSSGDAGPFTANVNVPLATFQLANPFGAPLGSSTVDKTITATYNQLVATAGGPASDKLG